MKEEGGQSLFGFFVGTLLDGKWLLTVTSISYFLELLFIHISRRGIKDLVQVQLSCDQPDLQKLATEDFCGYSVSIHWAIISMLNKSWNTVVQHNGSNS